MSELRKLILKSAVKMCVSIRAQSETMKKIL